MSHQFEDLGQAEAQVKSLDRAKRVRVHVGREIDAQTESGEPLKGKQLTEHLRDAEEDNTDKFGGGVNSKPEPEFVGIYNVDKDRLATTGSTQYDVITHEEAFMPMIEALREMGKSINGRIRTFDKGNVAILQAFFEDHEFEISDDSTYREGFIVKNTYNKSSSVVARPYWERMVCSNGMWATGDFGLPELRRMHRGDAEIVEEYSEWLEELFEESDVIREIIEDAMQERVEMEKVEIVLKHGVNFPEKRSDHVQEILQETVGENTSEVSKKEIYDAMTDYITHEVQGELAHSTEESYHRKANRVLTGDLERLSEPPVDDEQENLEAEKVEVETNE